MDDLLRKIIHIDMDAFYASVEQLDNPELRGKAIAVGGSEKRGVLTTASYEARKFGVKSAMPGSIALRKCPHIIFVKPRFHRYREISQDIREIFLSYTDLVEPLSLDEAYLDVTHNKKKSHSAIQIAKNIKQEIKEKTGLTASAGISINKFLAKIASDIHKPDGCTFISRENSQLFIKQLAIEKFHGVGKVTANKFKNVGIHNGKDLLGWERSALMKYFGKLGNHYYNIARGIDNRKVEPNRERKSISVERTFSDDITDLEMISEKLRSMSEMLAKSCIKKKIKGKTINLKLRYNDFTTLTKQKSFPQFIDDQVLIFETAFSLYQNLNLDNSPVRLLGVGLSNLERLDENLQLKIEL